jgi:hypothetical protein
MQPRDLQDDTNTTQTAASVHVAAGLFLQRILGITVIFFSISF